MNNLYLVIIILFFSQSFGQSHDISEHIRFLSSDSLKGRQTGSQEEKIASEYIYRELQKYKLKVSVDTFSFLYNEKEYTSQNIIAKSKTRPKKKTIILMAHYDHIGLGEYKSFGFSKNLIHNGADDNASGIGLLLHLAKKLKNDKKYNYIFLATSGHELGLFGSEHFFNNHQKLIKNNTLVINFDMVGRLNDSSSVKINGKDFDLDYLNKLKSEKLKIELDTTNILPLDHKIFVDNKIPAFNVTTGTHEDYHRPSDDFEKINTEGIITISNFILCFLEKIK